MACSLCGGSCKNHTEHFANMRGHSVAESVIKAKILPAIPVTTPVTTPNKRVTTLKSIPKVVTTRKSSEKEIEKVRMWREKNRARYNAYMRDFRSRQKTV